MRCKGMCRRRRGGGGGGRGQEVRCYLEGCGCAKTRRACSVLEGRVPVGMLLLLWWMLLL